MKENRTQDIFRNNLQALLNRDSKSSMRNLSASIDASESYIQKVLAGTISPSLDKINDICEYFDVDCWQMFVPHDESTQEVLAILQILRRMPQDALPAIIAYLEFIQNHAAQFS